MLRASRVPEVRGLRRLCSDPGREAVLTGIARHDLTMQPLASFRRFRSRFVPEISDTLLDEGAVPFPLNQGLLEKLDESLGLIAIMAGCRQLPYPVFLVENALRTLRDVLIGFDQEALLSLQLKGPFGKGNGHMAPSILPLAHRRIERL